MTAKRKAAAKPLSGRARKDKLMVLARAVAERGLCMGFTDLRSLDRDDATALKLWASADDRDAIDRLCAKARASRCGGADRSTWSQTMAATPLPSAERQKLVADTTKMREGIINVVTAWAALENNMALLLQSLLRTHDDRHVGFAIYYTPNNTETRFAVVDAAFRQFLGSIPETGAAVARWKLLTNKMARAKDTRNKIIHGNVATSFVNGQNHIRLIAPIYDFERHAKARKPKQLPGMSAHDVQDAANRFLGLSQQISGLLPVADLVRDGNLKRIAKTVEELEARLPLGGA